MTARTLLLPLAVVALAACRIEDRTPTGSRRDEEAVRAAVATFYRTASAQQWDSTRALLWDSAAVEVRPRADSGWLAFRSAADYVGYLAERDRGMQPGELGPRMVRTEFRQEGGIAAMWVATRLNERGLDGAVHEVSRTEHFVLRRVGPRWEIVNLVSAPEPVARER
ncbi:MAG TPA: hypothetical protein VFS40_03545 [Gemmatimonadales bacterium]|nr:hypothetical protein [Gemmatimonadales bacterium]